MIRKIVLALMFVSVIGHAQTSNPILATELFNQGRDYLAAGDYENAYGKLTESARLDPKVGTLARLAECEEKLGRMAAARGHWQRSLNVARSENDDRAAHVEQELARVDAVVPKVRITIVARLEGLDVSIDGTRIGVGALATALPVDAGSHVITVSASRKKPWSATVVTALDGRITDVEVPPLIDVPTPISMVAAPPRTLERSSTPLRVAGVSIATAGAAALGVGIGFAIDAKSKLDASNAGPDGCVMNACPPAAEITRLAARDSGTYATVFFVVGGVVSAAGVALLILAPVIAGKKVALHATPYGFDVVTHF